MAANQKTILKSEVSTKGSTTSEAEAEKSEMIGSDDKNNNRCEGGGAGRDATDGDFELGIKKMEYRDWLKGLYVAGRNFFLLLLNFPACLGAA